MVLPLPALYTLSLHDALPIWVKASGAKVLSSATTVAEAVWLEQHGCDAIIAMGYEAGGHRRSEEHTSELQSRRDLVCRLLLEKKKTTFFLSIDPIEISNFNTL